MRTLLMDQLQKTMNLTTIVWKKKLINSKQQCTMNETLEVALCWIMCYETAQAGILSLWLNVSQVVHQAFENFRFLLH